jgi:hypothetical protein
MGDNCAGPINIGVVEAEEGDCASNQDPAFD